MSTLSVQNIQGVSNLSISGGIAFANGTNAMPAIASASSPNTGIFFPAANTIAFSEGGVEAMRIDANSNMTVVGTVSMGSSFMRNRIINGDMRIDQRFSGTANTPVTDGAYTLDRWQSSFTAASKFSVQRSTTVPPGYTNSAIITSLSAFSLSATDRLYFAQRIEGYNIADLGWGAAGAQPVTLSFWIRSSLTGTFGGSIQNSAQTRSYPFSFAINSANTWEYKIIVVPGETTGTWLTDNSTGMFVLFTLGAGSTYRGPAGSWAAANYWGPTGGIDLVATNAATMYITGVQLEAGSIATPFERRLYGHELTLCQRYFEFILVSATNAALTNMVVTGQYKVQKRIEACTVTRTSSWLTGAEASSTVSTVTSLAIGINNPATNATSVGGSFNVSAEL